MEVDERSRHEMYIRLEQVLGADTANTLMSHLPPVGWADVVTKRNLDALEYRIDARFDTFTAELHGEIGRLEARLLGQMISQTRTMIIALVTVVLAVASLVVATG